MAARKRQRLDNCVLEDVASPAEIDWTLPADLLLEIVARSNTRTLIRCTATCKLLRRDILSPTFINRVTQEEGGIVPRCVLAYLNTHDDNEADPRPPPLSLVNKATSAAAVSFLDDHIMSRFTDELLGEYIPMTSRGGLVLLRRRRVSDTLSNLCVYDLLTGHRTYLSNPKAFYLNSIRRYVLLTAADGIGCSFVLFFAHANAKLDSNTHIIHVQTATSACPNWAHATMVHTTGESFAHLWYAMHRGAVVLDGGVIHWLVPDRGEIITYNVCTMEQGTIMLPAVVTNFKIGLSYLGSYYSSHDGRKLLRLMVLKEFKMYVWHQLSGGDWEPRDVMIDIMEKLRMLDPSVDPHHLRNTSFKWSGEGSNMVLLRYGSITNHRALVNLIDLETKEMILHYSSNSSMLLEVDLPSRLRAMKYFP